MSFSVCSSNSPPSSPDLLISRLTGDLAALEPARFLVGDSSSSCELLPFALSFLRLADLGVFGAFGVEVASPLVPVPPTSADFFSLVMRLVMARPTQSAKEGQTLHGTWNNVVLTRAHEGVELIEQGALVDLDVVDLEDAKEQLHEGEQAEREGDLYALHTLAS